MKVYEDYSQAQGFNTESTLKLGDDGRFSYEASLNDYTNVSLYGGAEGRWRQDGGGVIFHTERVDGTLPHPWVVDQELRAVEQGDTLVFPGGFTLRVPPERKEDIPIHNTRWKPLTVVLEPWGTRHVVEQGERVRVVARGPGGMGQLEVVRGEDEITVYGWSGSQVAVVREPKPQPESAASARAPAAGPPKLTAKPAAAPPAPPAPPRFEPRVPSPELAARVRRWVDETPEDGLQYLCKENDAIWLHSTLVYLWLLRADGQVLCIDHESFGRRAEPETDPVRAYAALAQGAREHPELGELLPPDRAGLSQCERCGGEGWTQSPPPANGTDYCQWCDGMGWHPPR
jgi:hypothetical protein